MVWLPVDEKSLRQYYLFVSTQYTNVTGRQTGGWTNCHHMTHLGHACSLAIGLLQARGKQAIQS